MRLNGKTVSANAGAENCLITSRCIGRSSVTSDDGSFTIDIQTLFCAELSCEDSDGVKKQEKRYLDLLPRLTRYGIHGENLFMYTDDNLFLLFRSE